jgi:hypothetical protein
MSSNNTDIIKTKFLSSLPERKVFISFENIMGVPTPFVLAGGVIIIFIVIFFTYVVGIIIGAVYFFTLYLIHLNDPDAARLWMGAFYLPDLWDAREPSQTTTIYIIEE